MCVLRSQRAGKTNLSSSRVSSDISSGVFIPVGCVMFLVPGTKYLTKNKLREEGLALYYNARAQIIFVGKTWQHRCEAFGHAVPTVRKQREPIIGVQLSPFNSDQGF